MSGLPWFRMYHEFATDPKVQMLSEADQRRFIMLLCMRCCNGDVTLQDSTVAFQLRISDADWLETKNRLIGMNLIDGGNKPTAWDARQKASDSSKSRVYKHRANKEASTKRDCNVTETVQIETKIEKEEEERACVFEGNWVSLSQTEYDELVTDYPRMEFPADLKNTDNWLASINAALPRPPAGQRLTRLRSALATKNAERRILAEQIANVAKPDFRSKQRSSSSGTPALVHKVSPDTVRYAKPRFDDEVKAHA